MKKQKVIRTYSDEDIVCIDRTPIEDITGLSQLQVLLNDGWIVKINNNIGQYCIEYILEKEEV